jgi:hypothetical protein
MKNDKKELIECLESIYDIIDNLNYKIYYGVFILNDSEMALIFYCRDYIFRILNNHKKE